MMIYITSEYYSINVDLLALVAALFLWISENLPPPNNFGLLILLTYCKIPRASIRSFIPFSKSQATRIS